MSYSANSAKIRQLTRDWGYCDAEELFQDTMFEGVQPGICMNRDCDYSTEYEPDQDHGWCECCDTNTVVSIGILIGAI